LGQQLPRATPSSFEQMIGYVFLLDACVNELEVKLQQMIRKRRTFMERTYVLCSFHAKQVACACLSLGGWEGLSHVSAPALSYPAASPSQDIVEKFADGSDVEDTFPELDSDTQPLDTFETGMSVDDTHVCTQCDEPEDFPDVAQSVCDTEEQDSDESLGFENIFGNLQPDVTNDVPDLQLPVSDIDGWEVLPGTSLDSWCFEIALQSA